MDQLLTDPEIVVGGVSLLVVIVGLVQIAKRLGFPSHYAGVLALVLGIAGSLAFQFGSGNPVVVAVVQGLALGLLAAGTYSAAKATAQGLNSDLNKRRENRER